MVVLELVFEMTHYPVLDSEVVGHVDEEGTRLFVTGRTGGVVVGGKEVGLGKGRGGGVGADVFGSDELGLVKGLGRGRGLFVGLLTAVNATAMFVNQDRVNDHAVLDGRQAETG